MATPDDIPVDTLAETENYVAWRSQEPDGEMTFHLELDSVTVHFFQENWEEFIELVGQLTEANGKQGKKRRHG